MGQTIGSLVQNVKGIAINSSKIGEGFVFVAIKGLSVDGHSFIEHAINRGAIVIICSELPSIINKGITYIVVEDTQKVAGYIAHAFYEFPTEKMAVVGITGTNGKTTVATMLYQLFSDLGYKVGLISTVINKVGNRSIKSTHTTPDAVSVSALLYTMYNEGCTYVFMEVSSHALDQYRTNGIDFKGAVFSNISHDHLDYHSSFKEYIYTKKKLFDGLSDSAFALTNVDDKRGVVMLQNTSAEKHTYGISTMSEFNARIIENTFEGLLLNIDGEEIHVPMVGRFNASNILAVYATARLLEQEKNEVLRILSTLRGAKGRFEYVRSNTNVIGVVDYAHTPDALKNILHTLNDIRSGNETLITLIGCGGNRDKLKRPLMGKVASVLSDKLIITSDNPRDEDPEEIISEVKGGVPPQHFKKVMAIVDRKEAIKVACNLAVPNDILLVAGKGHENYQEIKGERYPFDDKQVLVETFKDLAV